MSSIHLVTGLPLYRFPIGPIGFIIYCENKKYFEHEEFAYRNVLILLTTGPISVKIISEFYSPFIEESYATDRLLFIRERGVVPKDAFATVG